VKKETLLIFLGACACCLISIGARAKKKAAPVAQVLVQAGAPGCKVELDSAAVGETGPQGVLLLEPVNAGDHYIHVTCANQPHRVALVTVTAGQRVSTTPEPVEDPKNSSDAAPDVALTKRTELQRLVHQATDQRADGHFDEAIQELREATRMDPENSDLHRELGITFLMQKDWPRARVELIEAIRHDPQDADAHNSLGYALEKMGDLTPALDQYRLAMRLDPDEDSYRRHYLAALGELSDQQAAAKKKARKHKF
jgi:tetratricopeptide (TPR) repeat protein